MAAMSTVLYEKRGHIVQITINRPEVMNAFDLDTKKLINEAFREFDADDDAWIAIFTGAGNRAFCAGADLKRIYGAAGHGPADPVYLATIETWKPVIAAVNGYCMAGGFSLALRCDIRIAAEHATFALPQVRHGLVSTEGSELLARAVPIAIALEMLLTGKSITAREAERWGLVNKVVPLPELMAAANEMAETICQNGPLAVRWTKELVLRGIRASADEVKHMGVNFLLLNDKTEDRWEGPRAFAEKRKPEFKGR